MNWFVSKPKITYMSFTEFQRDLEQLTKNVELAMPGKTINVLEVGARRSGIVPVTYKIVDKVEHPSTELRSIAKVFEDKNPELADQLNLIAGQFKATEQ